MHINDATHELQPEQFLARQFMPQLQKKLQKARPFTGLLLGFFIGLISMNTSAAEWQKVSSLANTHVASVDELKSLHSQFSRKNIASYIEDAPNVRIHPGDLTLTGSLENDSVLIVQGDLSIIGNYHDYLDGTGVLVVLGQMRVENLYSWGALYVQKDLDASGLILTVYNDYTFEVDGKVNARALVISDKSAEYHPGKIGVTLDDENENIDDAAQKALALRIFEPEFFTKPDNLELDAYSELQNLRFDDELGAERILGGGAIFRAKTADESLISDVEQVLSPQASTKTLSELIGRDPLLAQLIAGRPELSEALHAPLFATRDEVMLAWLARRAPKFVATQLESHEITPALAEKLLEDPTLDATTLAAMVSSANVKVRALVARGAALDSAAANQLAQDADAAVRVAAISGQLQRLSANTISILALDSALSVRQEIAAAALSYADFEALSTTLDAEGLRRLSESLRSDAAAERETRMSEAERAQAIAQLLTNTKLHDAAPLFLALASAKQAEQFDALVLAKRLDIERVAEQTPSIEVMQKIIALADRLERPIPNRLARNPKLPLALQHLILARAIASKKVHGYNFDDSPRGALAELMQQKSTADEIVLGTAKFALDEGYAPGDGGYQNSLFHRHNLPRAAIELLHAKLRGKQDWALNLLSQAHANQSEVVHAVERWYEDAAINIQLKQAEKSAMPFWHALAHAKARELREISAFNANTPAAVLATLTQDTELSVARTALVNPNLASEIRLQFLLTAPLEAVEHFPLSLLELKFLLANLSDDARKKVVMRRISAHALE